VPELQGETQDIAKQKCKLASEIVKILTFDYLLVFHLINLFMV
jgi:hypothetical protein